MADISAVPQDRRNPLKARLRLQIDSDVQDLDSALLELDRR